MITLTDSQKTMLFNGRKLNGKLRRGFWSMDEYKQVGRLENIDSIINKYQDAKAFIYSGGGVQVVYTSDSCLLSSGIDDKLKDIALLIALDKNKKIIEKAFVSESKARQINIKDVFSCLDM